jgi:hypothetical protein
MCSIIEIGLNKRETMKPGRKPIDNPRDKYAIFLTKEEYYTVRVRAGEVGMSFSAYVRKLIQEDIESGKWKR